MDLCQLASPRLPYVMVPVTKIMRTVTFLEEHFILKMQASAKCLDSPLLLSQPYLPGKIKFRPGKFLELILLASVNAPPDP